MQQFIRSGWFMSKKQPQPRKKPKQPKEGPVPKKQTHGTPQGQF